MLLDICYKALYNNITRSDYEKNENKRLIEKSQKLESIVATMKERGESEEYIAEVFGIFFCLTYHIIKQINLLDFGNTNTA